MKNDYLLPWFTWHNLFIHIQISNFYTPFILLFFFILSPYFSFIFQYLNRPSIRIFRLICLFKFFLLNYLWLFWTDLQRFVGVIRRKKAIINSDWKVVCFWFTVYLNVYQAGILFFGISFSHASNSRWFFSNKQRERLEFPAFGRF